MKNILSLLFCLSLSWNVYATDPSAITTLHQQAYAYLDEHPDSAFYYAEQAERLAQAENLPLAEAQSLFIKAYLYRMGDDMGKSFIANLQAMELLRDLTSPEAVETYVQILLNSGELLKQHYAYPQAISYYDEGIALASQYGLSLWEQRLLYNKATALRHAERYSEALATVEASFDLAIAQADELRMLRSLNQKGLILVDLGDYEAARVAFTQIIHHEYKEEVSEKHLGHAWHNLAMSYAEEHRYPEARAAYLQALEWRQKRSIPSDLFITYMDAAEICLAMSHIIEADSLANVCESYYSEVALLPDHFHFFDLRSQIAYELQQFDRVHGYGQRYISENTRFLALQNQLLQVKDQYKMEMLTAGFFTELHAERNEARLLSYLLYLGIALAAIAALGRLHFLYKRWAIQRALVGIENDSPV